MVDFNERLIFSLEVSAAEFGAKLKRVISAATKNLTPELTVRSADIKFIGKVRAVDLFDLSGLSNLVAEAIKAGIQQGGAGAGINIGRAAAPGQLTGKALSDLFKTKGQATQSDIGKAFGTGDVIAKAVKQQNELTYAVKQTNSVLDLQSGKMQGPKQQTFVDITRQEKAQERLAAAAEKAQERIATAQEKAQERMARAEAKAEERRQRMSLPGRQIGGTSYGPVVPPIIDVTSNINQGIINASRSAANLGKIFLTLPIKFVANELNGVHRIIQKIGAAASQAFAPVKAILGTLIQSSAILTGVAGSGFIFGGPAFLPVAGIRLATSALQELSDQQHDTSLSVTQFSGEISKLSGADRVEFINNKFRDLSATIQDTAIEFGISTKEVSAGLAAILGAQVGVTSLSERLEALGASARVAVGGATTVSEAFSGLLPIVKTFNISFDDASDKLFAIQRIGVAPIRELAPEIGRLASVAKHAGVSLDEFGSAVGTLTQQGVPLNTVITGLGNIFVELSKGANHSVQEIIADINKVNGMKFSIGPGAVREAGGLGEYLGQLKQIMELPGGDELVAKLFPDARAIRASLPAIASLNDFLKNKIEIMHAEGEASAANAAVQQTLYKSIERVKVAFSTSIVEIGNHIANILHLKSVVDNVVESMRDFTNTARAISFPDLKAFIEDIFTSESGISSLIDFIGEQIKRITGFVISLTPDIFRAFSVIGVGSGLILVRSVGNALQEASKSYGNIAEVIEKLSEANPALAPLAGAMKAARLSTDLGAQALPSGSTKQSIKDAAFLVPGREWFVGLADSINEELSKGANSDGMKKLQDKFSSFIAKIDAKKLMDATGRLSDAMSQKLLDAEPLSKPLIDDFTRFINVVKARPIAISILGGKDAANNALTHVDDMLKELRKSMNDIGLANISLPTTFSNEAEIAKASDAYEELYAQREEIVKQMKETNPDYQRSDPELKGLNDAISEAFNRLYYAKKQGVMSSEIFDALGIKNAGGDVRHQLIAVEEEWLRVMRVIEGGGDSSGNLEKLFPALNNLRNILAAITLDTRDTSFNLVKFKEDALAVTTKVGKNISDNFAALFNKGFKFGKIQGGPVGLPFDITGDMSKNDLDQYSKNAKAILVNLKAQLAEIPEDNLTVQLRANLATTIAGVESLVKAIDTIVPAVNKATNMGAGFDTILFTVENKAEGIKSIFERMTGAIESSADATRRLADEQGKYTNAIKEAAAASGAAFGPQTLKESGFGQMPIYNDGRTQTFNVVPAAVGAVVRAGSDAAPGLNAQNTPPK